MQNHDWSAIKASINMLDLVSSRVKLKRAGNTHKGICPFHHEKGASFTVYPTHAHCFTGETMVITSEGRKSIKELSGSNHTILTEGGQWVDAPFKSYGVQKVYEVLLSRNGVKKTVRTTSGHRWFVHGKKSQTITTELISGQRLVSNFPESAPLNLSIEGIQHGIVFGDGTIYQKRGLVNLHGSKANDLIKYFPGLSTKDKIRDGVHPYKMVYGGRKFEDFKSLPELSREDSYLAGFLAGYIAADGHVYEDGTICLHSSNERDLEFVRDICTKLGIGTYTVTSAMRKGYLEYETPIYRIHFVASKFPANLLLRSAPKERFLSSEKKFDRLRWSVVSVTETESYEEVYCCEVPDTHSFTLDGNILTGNCYGCGWHGDAVDFVREFENCTVSEAIERLSGGVTITGQAAKKIMQEREQQNEQARQSVIAECQRRWEAALHPAPESHGYLAAKGIRGTAARLEGENLLIPVNDKHGNIQCVQAISPRQDDKGKWPKFFPKDGTMKGGRLNFGINLGLTIIAEGYATAESIYECLSERVTCAFSLHGVMDIVRELHSEGHKVAIAADVKGAERLAELGRELGVHVYVPHGDGVDDFNDMHQIMGEDAVKAVFAVTPEPIAIPETAPTEERHESEDNEPVNVFAKNAPPELPKGLLPPIIERFATIRAKALGSDPAGIAMSAFAVASAVLSDTIKLKVKANEDWTESPRLWVMLVGDPSYKKSPMMNAAASKVKKMDTAMFKDYNEKFLDWKETENGDPPVPTRLRIEDITMESAQDVCQYSPDGILAIQDELSGWFGGIEKYSGGKGGAKDRAFWLQAYGGGQYAVNRISRKAILIENLSISILGGIQPDAIRRIMVDATDDGLIQRFIPVVLQPASYGSDEDLPDVTTDYDELIERLHQVRTRCNWMNEYFPLRFDEGAQKIRTELYMEHHDMVVAMERINKKMASHLGKYEGLFPRLCIIWHCIENVNKEDLPEIITEDTARRVATFLNEYILKHSMAFYNGVLGLSEDQPIIEDIAEYILAHKLEKVTARTFQRGSSKMRKLTKFQISPILQQLEAFGWIDQINDKGDKLEAIVNPEVHRVFNGIAEEAKARRAATVALIRRTVGG